MKDYSNLTFTGTVDAERIIEQDNYGKPLMLLVVKSGGQEIFCTLKGEYKVNQARDCVRAGTKILGSGNARVEMVDSGNGQVPGLIVELDVVNSLSSQRQSNSFRYRYGGQQSNGYQQQGSFRRGNYGGRSSWGRG